MGTNFYIGQQHIGKRSAAGLYCWDCDTTLCKKGNDAIHISDTPDWHTSCPECGKTTNEEWNSPGQAASIELGFSNPKPSRPHGVLSCSSFTWAIPPEPAKLKFAKNTFLRRIRDEYGRKYTGKEFLQMLETNCPVQFTHMIGQTFF